MTIIVLDDHRSLFRDQSSFEKFVEILKAGMASDLTPIFVDKQHILGSTLSPAATRDAIIDRLAMKLLVERDQTNGSGC